MANSGTDDGTKLGHFVRRCLTGRHIPLFAGALGILLVMPSLGIGFWADDFLLKINLLGSEYFPEIGGAPWDALVFADGNAERMAVGLELGLVPWWTLEDMKLAFFRPLSSLTHWLDFKLWPGIPALMHLQNILLYGCVVAAAAVLYRRIMKHTVAAGLAALLYALDEAHATAASWISGRNGLLATLFGVLTIIAYDRWRRRGGWLGIAVVPLLLALALFSAEAGSGTLAFIIAYALFLDRGSWRSRLKGVLPCVMVVLLWGTIRTVGGYGAHGCEGYVDPITEPLSFVRVLLDCGPVLLFTQWGLLPLDLYPLYDAMLPGLARAVWLVAVGFMALVAFMILPLLRIDASARFWACGMILAVVPLGATNFPMDRILFFVGLGATPLLAQFLCSVWSGRLGLEPTGWQDGRFAAKILGGLFIFIHIIVAAVALPVRSALPFGTKSFYNQLHVNTPMDASVEEQDVIVVNAPGAGLIGMMPILRELNGQPVPRRVRILGPSMSAIDITRPDANTLVIEPEDGYFWLASDLLFRAKRYPMQRGQQIVLPGVTIRILSLNEAGFPAQVAFRFDVALEDPSLRWLHWVDGLFIPFQVPAIGERASLSAPNPFK